MRYGYDSSSEIGTQTTCRSSRLLKRSQQPHTRRPDTTLNRCSPQPHETWVVSHDGTDTHTPNTHRIGLTASSTAHPTRSLRPSAATNVKGEPRTGVRTTVCPFKCTRSEPAKGSCTIRFYGGVRGKGWDTMQEKKAVGGAQGWGVGQGTVVTFLTPLIN